MRDRSHGFLLLATMIVQACLIEIPTARAIAVGSSLANDKSRAGSIAQNPDATTGLERANLLVNEIKAAAYPELRDADIQVKLFNSEADYFRARFAIRQFFTGRRMRYLVFVNAGAFTRQAPEAGLRAIIAHELAHVLYFSQRNRLQLFGLVRLATKGFTARFERWADLQAIARGYGEGLKAYRRWLYRNIPAKSLEEKQRDYFSPEEIDAIVSATQQRPEMLVYWLKHVPRSLDEIKSATNKQ
ncbi:MAG: hypothetical protein V7641_2967 [Blastocatellia bacterium]